MPFSFANIFRGNDIRTSDILQQNIAQGNRGVYGNGAQCCHHLHHVSLGNGGSGLRGDHGILSVCHTEGGGHFVHGMEILVYGVHLISGAGIPGNEDHVPADLGGTGAVPASMETGLTGFTVKRLGGATRYDTNLQILQEAGIGERDILVCTGTGFADSLSASAVGLPILLVGTSLTSAQRSLLATCSGSIIIVGGWGAVSDTVASQLTAYGPVERLSGSTRYETSTMVAERFFDSPTNAVLAYAENFPDGLSGGPIANHLGVPLLLDMTSRESVAARYSSANGIRHGFILGGPALISDSAVRRVFSMRSNDFINVRQPY